VTVTPVRLGLVNTAASLAFGAGGSALASWRYALANGHAGQRAAERRADGSYGPAHELPSFVSAPLVFGRDRVVALVRPDDELARRVRVVFGSTSGRFGREQTIYRGEPVGRGAITRIAAIDSGRVAVVRRMIRRDGSARIVLLERRPRRPFGRARLVDEQPVCRNWRCMSIDGGIDVSVALSPRGDLVVAWQDGPWIEARVRYAGRRMGPVMRIGRFYRLWGGLRTAISARGRAWVAWFDQTVESGRGPMWIRLATRAPGAAAFGSVLELDHRESMEFTIGQTVRLALDPAGAAFVAWHDPDAKLASLDPGGKPIVTRSLGYGDIDALVTGRRPGEALVVWSAERSLFDGVTQLYGALTTPDGGFTGPEPIGPTAGVGEPAAAIDPITGSATVLWSQIVPASLISIESPPAKQRGTIHAATRAAP
jgi:hypothetical protein